MVLATITLALHFAAALPAAADVTNSPSFEPAVESTRNAVATQPANTDSTSTELPQPAGGLRLTATTLDPAGQNSQSLETIRVPSIEPAKPAKVISVEQVPSRKSWLILSIVQHSAATFDAASTRDAVSSGAHEADPMMRPFAGSPGIYAAIQGGPFILDYAARHMQRSSNNFLRHTWWLPQSASTGLFLFSGVHNLHVANAH
jgi:hypothetical protein